MASNEYKLVRMLIKRVQDELNDLVDTTIELLLEETDKMVATAEQEVKILSEQKAEFHLSEEEYKTEREIVEFPLDEDPKKFLHCKPKAIIYGDKIFDEIFTWYDVITIVAKLATQDKERVNALLKRPEIIAPSNCHPLLSNSDDEMIKPIEIYTGVYMEAKWMSTPQLMNFFVKEILQPIRFDASEITIRLVQNYRRKRIDCKR